MSMYTPLTLMSDARTWKVAECLTAKAKRVRSLRAKQDPWPPILESHPLQTGAGPCCAAAAPASRLGLRARR